MIETDLLRLFMQAAPFALPGIHMERRNIINEKSARGHHLKNGTVGQADAFAIYAGLHIEIETKAARGAMRDAQARWRARCLTPPMNWQPLCSHLVLKARRDESPEDTVTRWVDELRTVVEAQCSTK